MERTVPNKPKDTGLRYETQHYRVVIGRLSGPPDLAEEMRVKYIVQHRTDGVIYGVSGGLGGAIAAAIMAEKELSEAADMAVAADARAPGTNGAN